MVQFPPVPAEVKPLAHLLKLADEHDERNIVVAYWARMAACLLALKLVPGKKSPPTAELIRALLDWLEEVKKANQDNDGITNESAAQALIEEYALRLFEHGDQQDRAEIFNKNTIKTFYTSGMLMDVLDQFGTIPEDIREKRKYAKWKAAYIHNCLKSGDVPVPGPPQGENDESGIVHNSTLSEDELATYRKPMLPGPGDPTSSVPQSPAPENLGFNLPKPENIQPAPAPSPITPVVPQDPSGFVPASRPAAPPSNSNPANITPDQIQRAQKLCKYATSALNYDDVKNAVDYLRKALNLLEFGKEE